MYVKREAYWGNEFVSFRGIFVKFWKKNGVGAYFLNNFFLEHILAIRGTLEHI